MQQPVGKPAALAAVVVCACILSAQAASPEPLVAPLLLKAHPRVVTVAEITQGTVVGTITDVQAADFNGDGALDLAVAWYANDLVDPQNRRRNLFIFLNEGGGSFRPPIKLSLYIRNAACDALSIFRNGTGAVGVGDFDGDGDRDLAVGPFFGDELWFIENLGNGQFAKHLAFMFGINLVNSQSPPELAAADFDGDGRDELVYVTDPVIHIDTQLLHFWKTDGSIANMYRLEWEAPACPLVQWTRSLAVADFDGDGRADLCFTGVANPVYEQYPLLVFWYHLDPSSGYFGVHLEFPTMLQADVVDVRGAHPSCPASVIITDLNGTMAQYWEPACSGSVDFTARSLIQGYAAPAVNRGMAAVIADVNGDGEPDLVTKQKLGGIQERNQIQIALSREEGKHWDLASPGPLDSRGFQNDPNNQILRPRNLAVADLYGNALPEVIAGFAASPPRFVQDVPVNVLYVAIWDNDCLGDVNLDGRTDSADLTALWAVMGTCRGQPNFNPNADLNKNGCIDDSDRLLLMSDLGCQLSACENDFVGDADGDRGAGTAEMDASAVALTAGPSAWQTRHGVLGDAFGCMNDVNGDDSVNELDLPAFLDLLLWGH